jgi:serine protease Do
MQAKKYLVAGSLVLALGASASIALTSKLPALSDESATPNAGETTVATDAGARDSLAAFQFGPYTIADIAKAAAPAVVNIDVTGTKTQQLPFGGNLPFNFFFNGQQMSPQDLQKQLPKMEQRDTGSGFIIRSDGYIVTNAHVVKNADKIKVTLNDGRNLQGKVVGIDYFSDLALVKVDADNLPTLKMGSSASVRPGEFAIAIGSPLGFDHTVTLGIISAVGRSVTDINGNINFLQTDAAINPGNSGGPLLNIKGEVIGVNTAIIAPGRGQNIGFSIPIDVTKGVAESLIATGKILRPWLGIKMHDLDESFSKSLGIPVATKGVVIVGFADNSPAEASGLQQGDVIQKIDGRDMPTPKDVKEYVTSKKVSDVLHFLVLRKNTTQAVSVNVGDYQDMFKKKVAETQQQTQDRE